MLFSKIWHSGSARITPRPPLWCTPRYMGWAGHGCRRYTLPLVYFFIIDIFPIRGQICQTWYFARSKYCMAIVHKLSFFRGLIPLPMISLTVIRDWEAHHVLTPELGTPVSRGKRLHNSLQSCIIHCICRSHLLFAACSCCIVLASLPMVAANMGPIPQGRRGSYTACLFRSPDLQCLLTTVLA